MGLLTKPIAIFPPIAMRDFTLFCSSAGKGRGFFRALHAAFSFLISALILRALSSSRPPSNLPVVHSKSMANSTADTSELVSSFTHRSCDNHCSSGFKNSATIPPTPSSSPAVGTRHLLPKIKRKITRQSFVSCFQGWG
eukprot:TRINITY_DN327_c0_g2_i4.p1 TRINITY_DN327_c0_g2~~TRINITY_DN327_c0_g2_i4.p1  ORF type:complete len:139 (-),score=11.34 TRINITY_DN327_c0_g2_i4:77-493(-)